MPRRRLPPNVRRHGSGYRAAIERDRKKVVGPVRATAEQAAADAAAMRAGALTSPTRLLNLKEGFTLVLQDLAAENRRPATVKYYRNHFRIITRHWSSHTLLHRITQEQIRRYIQRRQEDGITPQTISGKELQVLARIIRLAKQRGHLRADPFEGLRLPRGRSEPFTFMLSHEIAACVLRIREAGKRLSERDADIVSFSFLTGLRRSEMARLQRPDVRVPAREIRVDGKNAQRIVPMNTQCVAVSTRLLERGTKQVVGGERLIEKVFSRWRDRLAEPRLAPRAMRHSYGTALAHAGIDPYTIRDLMGHSNLDMALRYIHRSGPKSRAAADSVTL